MENKITDQIKDTDSVVAKEDCGEPNERREFLSKAGMAALGVPATALLVSVASKRANASDHGSCG